MSPLSRVYKAGSIIYFENDSADHVFVLQKGIVNLNSFSPETQGEIQDTIKSGEFFGVKSALGRFPREETAQVVSDAAVMVLSVQEFEVLALKNHKLVMKMLKVFSNQLRRIGKSIQNWMGSGDSDSGGSGLFRIGEYYLKNKRYNQALYAYEKYLQHYGSGDYAQQCRQRIEMARSGASTGYAIASDGTSFSAATAQTVVEEPAAPPESNGHMAGSSIDSAKQYYEAVSLYSQSRFEDAYKIFNQIVEASADPNDAFVEKSRFEVGRCLMNLNKCQEAISSFTDLVRLFPKTENMKTALFLIGKCHALQNEVDKAKGFYAKVIGMPPVESINKRAQKALDELGVG